MPCRPRRGIATFAKARPPRCSGATNSPSAFASASPTPPSSRSARRCAASRSSRGRPISRGARRRSRTKAGPGFSDPDYELSDEWRAHARTAARRAAALARPRDAVARAAHRAPRARNDGTCPGEMSKTFRLAELAREVLDAGRHRGRSARPEPASPPTTTATSIRARAACRPPCRCATGHAAAIRTTRSRQTNDWMNEIYEQWVCAHGVLLHHAGVLVPGRQPAQADDGPPGVRRRRQSRPDHHARQKGGARPRRSSWPAGLIRSTCRDATYGVVVHGDVAGIEGARRALCDWLDWMGLIDAGHRAGSTASSATTSPTPPAIQRSTTMRWCSKRCATSVGPWRRQSASCAAARSANRIAIFGPRARSDRKTIQPFGCGSGVSFSEPSLCA